MLSAGLVAAVLAISISEQPRTLVGPVTHSGGFGGPVLKVGRVADETGVFFGGRGGWVVNHTFVLGGGGYGLVSDHIEVRPQGMPGGRYVLEMGYGGLELEVIQGWRNLFHLTGQLLLGGGSAGYREEGRGRTIQSDAFFVAEPSVHGEANVTGGFRVAVGIGWRLLSGFSIDRLPQVSNRDLGGLTGSLTFKFGSL